MLNFISIILPYIENYQMNQKVFGKIADLYKGEKGFTHMQSYSDLDTDIVKEFYNDTFDIKNKLEDKAKLNITGLTIAISLIFGLSTLVGKINENIGIQWLRLIVELISVFSLLYMVSAGILSIAVLIKHNTVNKIRPSDFVGNEENKKMAYALNTELNVNMNVIRNNYIYTSYECIRNAFICLVIIFIISIVMPNFLNSKSTSASVANNNLGSAVFCEGSIKSTSQSEISKIKTRTQDVINRSNNYISAQANGKEINICDEKMGVFVKVVKTNNYILVIDIEEPIHLLK